MNSGCKIQDLQICSVPPRSTDSEVDFLTIVKGCGGPCATFRVCRLTFCCTERATTKCLQYTEAHGRHKRSRAATMHRVFADYCVPSEVMTLMTICRWNAQVF